MTETTTAEWNDPARAVTEAARQGQAGLDAVADQARATAAAVAGQARNGFATAFGTGFGGGESMLDAFRAGTETFTASLDAGFNRVTDGLTALNVKAVDVLRENVNASFELWERMLGTRTMAQVLEVQADHARRRIEVLGAQGRDLAAMAGQVAAPSFETSRGTASH